MKYELCNRNILNLTALNKHIVYSHHESILYYYYNKSLNCWLNNIRLIHIYEFEDFNEQLQLIKDLIYYGFDNYDRTNNNKYFNFDNHKPSIIYKSNNCIIYGA